MEHPQLDVGVEVSAFLYLRQNGECAFSAIIASGDIQSCATVGRNSATNIGKLRDPPTFCGECSKRML